MTELKDIDSLLRDSFARIAEPGDPAGVVDSIRARMDAGDTGTPANSSGFGSRRGWFWPYLAGAVVLGVLGGALGASGVFSPTVVVTAGQPSTSAQSSAAPATPSPSATATPTPTPTPAPTPTEEPPPPPPAPAPDTSGPKLSTPTATPNDDICADDGYAAYYAITSTIAAAVSDNVGVTGVHITWSGVESGAGEMTPGSSWTFIFNPAQSTPTGTVTFTLVARDAAGNLSDVATTFVDVIAAGTCLI
jgi:hypothetical protein